MFAEEMLSPLVYHFLFDAHCMWTWCLPCHNYTSYFRTIFNRPLAVECFHSPKMKLSRPTSNAYSAYAYAGCNASTLQTCATTLIYSLDWCEQRRQFMYWSINKLCLTVMLYIIHHHDHHHNRDHLHSLLLLSLFFYVDIYFCCFWFLQLLTIEFCFNLISVKIEDLISMTIVFSSERLSVSLVYLNDWVKKRGEQRIWKLNFEAIVVS